MDYDIYLDECIEDCQIEVDELTEDEQLEIGLEQLEALNY